VKRVGRRDAAASIAGAYGLERAAAADRTRAVAQARASITVAGHALDVGDCRELLSMLGLDVPTQASHVPARALAPSAEEHVR
jgi:hypothetical protein